MALKLAVSGKGGVGKSTLCGTLARLFANDGYKVLAVDADPDANLASAVGMPVSLQANIKTISKEADIIKDRTGATPGKMGQMFSLAPDVSGIAEICGVNYAGVDVVVLGAVKTGGSGCACPESILLKSLVMDMVLYRDEIVILDMEAGIEHLGRGTAMGVDAMIVVVEPGSRSIETANRIKEMSESIGIKKVLFVLNKYFSEDDIVSVNNSLGNQNVIGYIPFDMRIAKSDKEKKSLLDMDAPDLVKIYSDIKDKLFILNK